MTEADLTTDIPKLTGKIDRAKILHYRAPRPPEGVIEGLRGIADATSVLSDIMDEMGITGVVAASEFRPTIEGSTMVGPALTVRNILLREHEYEAARRQLNRMAEFEAHNLALPGDVVVIQGVPMISNMGGISAQIGKRQGETGAIVSGGIRDVEHSRRIGYPIWATEITPVTGKWRIETVEINGDVEIGKVRVSPGDLVVADATGICFIPRLRAAEILKKALGKAAAEDIKCRAIDSGTAVADLPTNA